MELFLRSDEYPGESPNIVLTAKQTPPFMIFARIFQAGGPFQRQALRRAAGHEGVISCHLLPGCRSNIKDGKKQRFNVYGYFFALSRI